MRHGRQHRSGRRLRSLAEWAPTTAGDAFAKWATCANGATSGLNAKAVATLYVPYRQFTLAYGGVVVRTRGAPEALIAEIRRQIARVDPTIPLRAVSTVEARLSKTLDTPRFYAVMAVACAFVAILFVTLGLYGVISYAVSRRTPEIGIRMALGAPRERILQGVLWEGTRMAAIGVSAGIGISLAATRLFRTLLFEVRPIDPSTLAIAAGLVIAVTLAASYFPARRASRIHPMAALHYD